MDKEQTERLLKWMEYLDKDIFDTLTEIKMINDSLADIASALKIIANYITGVGRVK